MSATVAFSAKSSDGHDPQLQLDSLGNFHRELERGSGLKTGDARRIARARAFHKRHKLAF